MDTSHQPTASGPEGTGGKLHRGPLRLVEAEAQHLRELEAVGESAATPFIAMVGLALVLFPLAGIMIAVSFGAALLFGG